MTAVVTTTAANALEGFNQRKIDRCQNGVLWTVELDGATSTLKLYYSTDAGTTWTAGGSVQAGATAVNGTHPSIFIDLDDNLHVAFKATGVAGGLTTGFLYYLRATPNAARTAWTWGAAYVLSNAGGAGSDYPDLCVARRPGSAPTTWDVFAVWSYSGTFATYVRLALDASGAVASRNLDGLTNVASAAPFNEGGLNAANAGGNNYMYPSIDLNHTGDGKTVAGGLAHVYVTWNMAAGDSFGNTNLGQRFRKATYAAGAWTWGADVRVDSRFGNTQYWHTGHFDGTRFVIAGLLASTGTGTTNLFLWDVDVAALTVTARISPVWAPATHPMSAQATYDSAGNVYIVGRDNAGASSGTRNLAVWTWTRATNTLGAEVVLDNSAPDAANPHVKRGYAGAAIDAIYSDGTASPYTVTYVKAASFNQAPNASTGLTPASGTVDRTAVQRLSWTFSDPNAGDTQSAFDLQWRLGAGAWNTVNGSTPNAFYDVPAGTFPAGTIEWQVRTYDALGVAGPWSASAFFGAASPPAAPAITAPVNGSTLATNVTVATWAAPGQEAYQVRTVADNAGVPDTGTIYTDTGAVTDAAARTRSVTFGTNNRYEHLQVRVRNNGLWSTWASVRVQISFTPPPAPSVVTAVNASQAAIAVTITNPAPAGGEPALAYNDLYRRVAGVGSGVRIGTGLPAGVFTDRTPASGVAYQYLARAVATNGTTRDSAWTA